MADPDAPFGLLIEADDEIEADHDLRAQILTGRVGMVHVSTFSAPPLEAALTPELIRIRDPAVVKIHLHVQVRGHTAFLHGDRQAALSPGDLTLLDLSRPFRMSDREDEHEVVKVKFPPAAQPLRHDELERLIGVPISGRDGLGAPLSSLARHIGRHLEDYGPTEGARLATALMDLLIVALAERLDRVPTMAPATRRRVLLANVQMFIDQQLPDPDLSPGVIAAANHISLRYLYKLFETQQTSVGGWIRQRRLERCRRDLVDPTLGDWPVSAIAARWGLTDPARFSRLFHAAYGLPPSEYRLTAGTTTKR